MTNMRFSCSREQVQRQSYVPPVISNGILCTQIDFRGEQRPENYFGMVPGIHLAGRRYPGSRSGELIPFGYFTADDPGRLKDWLETLDCRNGAIETVCQYSGKHQITTLAFADANHNILAIRKKFSNVNSYRLRYVFGSAPSQPPRFATFTSQITGHRLLIDYKIGDYHGQITLLASPGVQWQANGNEFFLSCPDDTFGFELLIGFNDSMEPGKPANNARKLAKIMETSGFDTLFNAHCKKWHAYWRSFSFSIPDREISAMHITTRYFLKCSSTPWTLPVGIFPSHWRGTYFSFNNFVPVFASGGHFREARKVPAFRHSLLDLATRRISSRFYPPTGARYVWQSNEDGEECASPGHWIEHVMHMGNIAEEAFDYYNYTRDLEYLREIGYPVIRRCADFYINWMIYELSDGRTIIGSCTDLERLGPGRRNAFMTTCAAIGTLQWAATSAKALDCDHDEQRKWLDTSECLRRSLPHDEHKYLPYEGCAERSVGVLSGLYPYNSISRQDPMQKNAVEDFCANYKAVGNMYRVGQGLCSWYAAWYALALLRLGEKQRPLEFLKQAASQAGCFGEIFEINEPGMHVSVPWCTCPAGAYALAVTELLLQANGDRLIIGGGARNEWNQWSFSLHAPDDLKIRAEYRKNHPLKLKITAGKRHSGTPKELILPNGSIRRLKLIPGESYQL